MAVQSVRHPPFDISACQKLLVNQTSRSDTIAEGIPKRRKTLTKNNLAKPVASPVMVVGKKIAILDQPQLGLPYVPPQFEVEDQSVHVDMVKTFSGMDKGLNGPAGRWLLLLVIWQVGIGRHSQRRLVASQAKRN